MQRVKLFVTFFFLEMICKEKKLSLVTGTDEISSSREIDSALPRESLGTA